MIPQDRLTIALLVGAGLVVLCAVSPLVWPLAAVFFAYVVVAALLDARSLPGRSALSVHRSVPMPFSLGARGEAKLQPITPAV